MNVKTGTSATRDDIAAEADKMEDAQYWERADHLSQQPGWESSLTEGEGAGVDWANARVKPGDPGIASGQKQELTVRIDRDVLDWFKSQGKGYQTRMNAVLRRYMEHEKKAG